MDQTQNSTFITGKVEASDIPVDQRMNNVFPSLKAPTLAELSKPAYVPVVFKPQLGRPREELEAQGIVIPQLGKR